MGLLVKDGTLVDGTGAPARPADVRVADGRIVEIGVGLRSLGDDVIDAGDAVVAPGFIDTHTHFDASVFWDPFCDPMPQHGVTTVLMGNCSLSLAPVRPSCRAALSDAFSFIEDLPREAFETSVPWDWESYPEYMASMRDRHLGVNFAGLVGHSMLRMFVLGASAWERSSSPDETARVAEQLDDAMRAGAFGMSTSLFDRDSNGRAVPSLLADDDEFERLCQVLGAHRAVLEVIPSLPDVAAACTDLERFGEYARRYDTTVLWNGLADLRNDPTYAPTLLRCSKAVAALGTRLHPLYSPRPIEVVINFYKTMAFMFLPAWNEAVQAKREVKCSLLADAGWRSRARLEWDTERQSFFPVDHLEQLRISRVGRADFERFMGASFSSVVTERGGHPSDVLADWLLDNDIDTTFVHPIANTDLEMVSELLRDPLTMVSASDAGAHIQMFCASGDTTLLLTRHVRDRGDLTLEAAVHELTGRQASVFGFRDRGTISEGAMADLTVFALDELEWDKETVVFDLPTGGARFRRPPGGYRFTVVNGVVVQEAGEFTGNVPGRMLGVEDHC